MIKHLTAAERVAVRRSLFPESAESVLSQSDFPWHRDSSGVVTATMKQSSQALAIGVFGALKALNHPTPTIDALAQALGLDQVGPWQISLERPVEANVLGEPRSTQLDVTIESPTCLLVVECKFTEPDGGACSQPKKIGGTSAHRGLRQCNGNYEMQVNPLNGSRNRCALSGKGVRYWETIPEILDIDPGVDHVPCPFNGGAYQWMRNLVAARKLAAARQRPACAIVYADGPFPMAKKVAGKEWQAFKARTAGKSVPLTEMSYQRVLDTLRASATTEDRSLLERLTAWATQRIDEVAAAL